MDFSNIKDAINPLIKDLNLYVYSIEYKNHELEILLDRKGFIDSDEIINASNIINPIIDKIDPIDEEYSLIIASRGVEKDFSIEDSSYYLNEYIGVKTFDQLYKGYLVEVKSDYLVIKNDKNKNIKINYNDIESMSTLVKF